MTTAPVPAADCARGLAPVALAPISFPLRVWTSFPSGLRLLLLSWVPAALVLLAYLTLVFGGAVIATIVAVLYYARCTIGLTLRLHFVGVFVRASPYLLRFVMTVGAVLTNEAVARAPVCATSRGSSPRPSPAQEVPVDSVEEKGGLGGEEASPVGTTFDDCHECYYSSGRWRDHLNRFMCDHCYALGIKYGRIQSSDGGSEVQMQDGLAVKTVQALKGEFEPADASTEVPSHTGRVACAKPDCAGCVPNTVDTASLSTAERSAPFAFVKKQPRKNTLSQVGAGPKRKSASSSAGLSSLVDAEASVGTDLPAGDAGGEPLLIPVDDGCGRVDDAFVRAFFKLESATRSCEYDTDDDGGSEGELVADRERTGLRRERVRVGGAGTDFGGADATTSRTTSGAGANSSINAHADARVSTHAHTSANAHTSAGPAGVASTCHSSCCNPKRCEPKRFENLFMPSQVGGGGRNKGSGKRKADNDGSDLGKSSCAPPPLCAHVPSC